MKNRASLGLFSGWRATESAQRVRWPRHKLPACERCFHRLEAYATLAVIVLVVGCQQKMADQPSYKPLDACELFADGRSARPLPPGTVARGHLHSDIAFWTGRHKAPSGDQELATGYTQSDLKATMQPKDTTAEVGAQAGNQTPVKPKPMDDKVRYAEFVDEFPLPLSEQFVQHGRDRFMIYCVVCHDPTGTGHGKIVQRGYTPPPSYHIDRLRNAPVGYLYAVISEGYGSMPSYSAQITPFDRWAIVSYIRALQASQHHPEPAVALQEQGANNQRGKAP